MHYMNHLIKKPLYQRLKLLFIGKARNVQDEKIFQRLTLIAFFAWIGLGSDGLSSSCYGPDEAYRFLGEYHRLAIVVAIAIVLTIVIISISYSQIIKLFPSGGGGYKVATKLLSPRLGMISGCALIVDYVLTIAMSVSSGADALFSFFGPAWQPFKIYIALIGIIILILLNLRGVKESVFSLMPIFMIFIAMHAFLLLYSIFRHSFMVPQLYNDTIHDFHNAGKSLGWAGVVILILRSYSMGAGTYTGIEAVSNSIPILKEPRVKTGLITMRYMAVSLALLVLGLMFSYTLFNVTPSPYKTMNASLMEAMTAGWNPGWGTFFILVTLVSEAALLFIAAQTGFLDGPRVISSMAQDSWFPRRFTVLSDRLVTQNGILFMGIIALAIVWLTHGSVAVLVVLYSINVFITFALSQSGMVRHWWLERKSEKRWKRKLMVNGIGLVITLFILGSVVIIKFREGGWITIIITSLLVIFVTFIKRHYNYADKLIKRLNIKMFQMVDDVYAQVPPAVMATIKPDVDDKTAVICVGGYNGLGIMTFFKVMEEFSEYRNIVFLEIGLVDSANFRGNEELGNLKSCIKADLVKYQQLAEHFGYHTEIFSTIGTDVADEIKELAKTVNRKYRHSVFFVGQFLLPKATAFQRMLHNQTQFAIHNRLSHKGMIMVMIPIRSHVHI